MPKRITNEQIATARQAFIDGFSLPEAAKIAKMSLSSCKKYLRSDINTYLKEHEEAANKRLDKEASEAKKAIEPEPINFMTNEVIKDDLSIKPEPAPVDDNKIMLEVQQEQDRLLAQELDNQKVDQEQPMTDDQFISLLEYEFEQVNNYEQAKELYWEYKPQSIINITHVEAFRDIYEQTLNRVGKIRNLIPAPTISEPTIEDNLSGTEEYIESIKNNTEPESVDNNNDYMVGRLEWGQKIDKIRSTLNIHIPMPRKSSMVSWTDERLTEHLWYWIWKPYRDTYFGGVGFNKLLRDNPTANERWEIIDRAVRELQMSPVEQKLIQIQLQIEELEQLGVNKNQVRQLLNL